MFHEVCEKADFAGRVHHCDEHRAAGQLLQPPQVHQPPSVPSCQLQADAHSKNSCRQLTGYQDNVRAPADVIQMCLSCLQRITSRNDHPLRSPCYVMTSALAPLVHRFPATPPPPPPASRSATLASLLAEERFNLYYLLAILFPVITAILGEVGRDHVADLQHYGEAASAHRHCQLAGA